MSRHAPCGATFAAQQRRRRGTIGTGHARARARGWQECRPTLRYRSSFSNITASSRRPVGSLMSRRFEACRRAGQRTAPGSVVASNRDRIRCLLWSSASGILAWASYDTPSTSTDDTPRANPQQAPAAARRVRPHRDDRELRLQLHSQAQKARLFDLRQLMSGPLRTRTPIVTASHGSQQNLAGLSIDVIYIR